MGKGLKPLSHAGRSSARPISVHTSREAQRPRARLKIHSAHLVHSLRGLRAALRLRATSFFRRAISRLPTSFGSPATEEVLENNVARTR